MARGFTLADVPHRVTWRALKVFVAFAPRESALFRVAGPVAQQWGAQEHLLALLADLTQTLVWMQSKDGAANRHRPKPIRRPGDPDPNRKYGATLMDLGEARAWQAKRRAGELLPMTMAEVVT